MKTIAFWVLATIIVLVIAACIWAWTPDKSRAELEARYLNQPTDYVDVAGIRLHVRDSGPKDAPALVLLHGFGSSLHTWETWAGDLAHTYRVIRFDIPGFGLTGPDPTGDYSSARMDTVIAALLDRLPIQRAVLIGNSMGGGMAWRFAARHPDRVSKLVLISPDGFASFGLEYGRKPTVPVYTRLLRYTLPRYLVRSSLAGAYENKAALTDAIFERYYDLLLAPGVRDAILDRVSQTMLEPPGPLLARITVPTLLLWGDKDALIPISNAADYLKALPAAELVTLAGVGHLPQEEAPAPSLDRLKEFLAR